MYIRREEAKDVKHLSLALGHELNSLAVDILEKTSYLSTVEVIDILRSAIDCLFEDTTDFYNRRLNELEDNFYRNEPVA